MPPTSDTKAGPEPGCGDSGGRSAISSGGSPHGDLSMHYTRHKHIATALVITFAILAVAVFVATAPVAADTDDADNETLFEDLSSTDDLETSDDEDLSGFEAARQDATDAISRTYTLVVAASSGLFDRIEYETSNMAWFGGDADLGTQANDTVVIVNEHDDALVDYLNNQTSAAPDGDREYHEFALVDDGDAERFYVGLEYNHDRGEYTDLEAARETDHDIDEEHVHRGLLAEETADETVYLLENYVEEGEPIDEAYVARSSTRYAGLFGSYFESTLLGDDLEHLEGDE